ncbi:unnamed protein product [Zymoseptoria tritici ST99CH_1E4]|uniref:Hydrophobin n=1 Tax=Zymoseptoria tritici ST99CH_1E4 TaxID=1276532 RepID=A0A2H1FWQ0_ZYMTR|nr:unnamed protein product [Zymoseptoria tritici ST99CH_1E4]
MHAFKLLAMLFVSSAFAFPAHDGAAAALGHILVKRCTSQGSACHADDCCNAQGVTQAGLCYSGGPDPDAASGLICH